MSWSVPVSVAVDESNDRSHDGICPWWSPYTRWHGCRHRWPCHLADEHSDILTVSVCIPLADTRDKPTHKNEVFWHIQHINLFKQYDPVHPAVQNVKNIKNWKHLGYVWHTFCHLRISHHVVVDHWSVGHNFCKKHKFHNGTSLYHNTVKKRLFKWVQERVKRPMTT